MAEIEDIKKEVPQKSVEELLLNSKKLIRSFYIRLFIGLFIFFSILPLVFRGHNFLYLIIASAVIFLGNLIIALTTQKLQYILLKLKEQSYEKKTKEDPNHKNEEINREIFLYSTIQECSIRCSAGILEMVFYTIAFATNTIGLVVGYLVLKVVSVWKSDKDQKSEGLFTGVLRIAIILSLLFSLFASYFLFKYLQSFPAIFKMCNHFLFQ
ncbi:MAG: hypothetical protein US35_C0014G0020 [Parcubacteria group bacterium GW2011_GWA2_37_10]|nr:MAG: hypothetical protein US35_C0014G0020 [Parcubacteria group bacterium GW2011_GWA2_37_10]HLD38213.1 hypothetical protein [Candidatus Nanoarchaeia archaeon]